MREQVNNLNAYVDKYHAEFETRIAKYNATGQIEWDAGSWDNGEKGVAWLKETKDMTFNFNKISKKTKGLTAIDISPEFQSFMRAYHMQMVCSVDGLLSGSTLAKPLQVMKRWYYEMFITTGQMHPMYLTADIIHGAMERHRANSKSAHNVSDYCDVAVTIIENTRRFNLTLMNVEVRNKYPCRNQTNSTKERRKAQQADPDKTNDEKLISIRAFICVIELVVLAKNDAERIFYNMLLLGIICGFRFQEIMILTQDSLVKREITNKNKRQHAAEQGWPDYRLGIKYLGAKQAGWRVHWLAPSSYPVVEAIYTSLAELTAESRQLVISYRKSKFTDFLPDRIKELPDDLVESRELLDTMFTGTGGATSIRLSIKKYSGEEPTVIPVHKQRKNYFYTKEQLNNYVFQRYAAAKNFSEGHQCVISAKNGGNWEHFNYEDLLFLAPEGSFFIDFDLVSLMHPVPLEKYSLDAWLGGIKGRKSIFDAYSLFEDDGSRISIKKHVPRHNINTFLAIAGVTDHIQAILMGRIDITQNKHYQHQAESQSYQTASLAVTSLENAYEENKQATQLSLFDANGKPSSEVTAVQKTEISRRMAALSKSQKYKNTGVAAVKASTSILVDPKLSIEHNLKQNMQTFGETTDEVAHYLEGVMSDNFLPDLKHAHDKLLKQNMAIKAKELLERHAKLHPLGFGACTRDVSRWGCPHAMKCQSGIPCGYFSITGRMGEAEEISQRLADKQKELVVLRKLNTKDPSYELALKEQEEALIVFKALKSKAVDALNAKKLVSLLSEDKYNPFGKIIERINEQMLIGKTPNTLADLFFIEQKRFERDVVQKEDQNG